MKNEQMAELDRWLTERIALCGQRGQALCADGRGDEAAFEKIRANVYDIFRTVLSVAERSCGDGAARRFLLQKLESIPSGWSASYEKAQAHDDPVKARIERIKLDTAGEIRAALESVWKEGAE